LIWCGGRDRWTTDYDDRWGEEGGFEGDIWEWEGWGQMGMVEEVNYVRWRRKGKLWGGRGEEGPCSGEVWPVAWRLRSSSHQGGVMGEIWRWRGRRAIFGPQLCMSGQSLAAVELESARGGGGRE
jgi:hypothetical protein